MTGVLLLKEDVTNYDSCINSTHLLCINISSQIYFCSVGVEICKYEITSLVSQQCITPRNCRFPPSRELEKPTKLPCTLHALQAIGMSPLRQSCRHRCNCTSRFVRSTSLFEICHLRTKDHSTVAFIALYNCKKHKPAFSENVGT